MKNIDTFHSKLELFEKLNGVKVDEKNAQIQEIISNCATLSVRLTRISEHSFINKSRKTLLRMPMAENDCLIRTETQNEEADVNLQQTEDSLFLGEYLNCVSSARQQSTDLVSSATVIQNSLLNREIYDNEDFETSFSEDINDVNVHQSHVSLNSVGEDSKDDLRLLPLCDALEDFAAYLATNDRNGHLISKVISRQPSQILSIVKLFLKTTEVNEVIDLKFVICNIHLLLQTYLNANEDKSWFEIRDNLHSFLSLSKYLQVLRMKDRSILPYFSAEVFETVVSVLKEKIKTMRYSFSQQKFNIENISQYLQSVQNSKEILHGVSKFLVSTYVASMRKAIHEQYCLLGSKKYDIKNTILFPANRSNALKLQGMLILSGCLRSCCSLNKLISLTLEEASQPAWLDRNSVLLRPRSLEKRSLECLHIWWTAQDFLLLQLFILHYRPFLTNDVKPSSPLFLSFLSTKEEGRPLSLIEVFDSCEDTLRSSRSRLSLSSLSPDVLRNVYMLKLKSSGCTNDEICNLSWALGNIDIFPMRVVTVRILRNTINQSKCLIGNLLMRHVIAHVKKSGKIKEKPSSLAQAISLKFNGSNVRRKNLLCLQKTIRKTYSLSRHKRIADDSPLFSEDDISMQEFHRCKLERNKVLKSLSRETHNSKLTSKRGLSPDNFDGKVLCRRRKRKRVCANPNS